MIPKIPEDISIPDPVLGITSILCFFLGALFIILACSCIKQIKPWRAGFYALISLVLLSTTAITVLSVLNIHSYQRFSQETKVADIHFYRISSQLYLAEIQLSGSEHKQQFRVMGDQWQLSARVIKWQAPLTVLEFDSLYRLDRLQGRYAALKQERYAPRSVYSLNVDSNLDLWSLIEKYKHWLPWLDAYYGSATYLPMANDASFQINMTQLGLLAKPLNEAASHAVGKWD
ncbi:MAG: hypothetical protein ACI909_002128 [Planctomycetota bacterium]|jgi:hypothetical protein